MCGARRTGRAGPTRSLQATATSAAARSPRLATLVRLDIPCLVVRLVVRLAGLATQSLTGGDGGVAVPSECGSDSRAGRKVRASRSSYVYRLQPPTVCPAGTPEESERRRTAARVGARPRPARAAAGQWRVARRAGGGISAFSASQVVTTEPRDLAPPPERRNPFSPRLTSEVYAITPGQVGTSGIEPRLGLSQGSGESMCLSNVTVVNIPRGCTGGRSRGQLPGESGRTRSRLLQAKHAHQLCHATLDPPVAGFEELARPVERIPDCPRRDRRGVQVSED